MALIGNPIVSTDFPKDTFSGNGATVAFTMSIAPASVNAVIVVVSGITQDPSTYTISGTTLTFSAAPPTGTSNISVRHLGVAGTPYVPATASVGISALSATGTPSSSTFLRGDGAWETPASGMTLINTTSFSSASSTAVDSVFSNTYTNYLIIVNETAISGNFDLNIQFRTGGSTNSTSNYNFYGTFTDSAGGANPYAVSGNTTMGVGSTITRPTSYYIYVSQPYQTANTQVNGNGGGGQRWRSMGGDFSATTSFDGFILTCSSNNHTGSFKVYGLS